jgi:hypothetical protein
VKSCSYCGRQNELAAVNCAGCGTELPAPPAAEPSPDETVAAVEPPDPILADLDMGFEVSEGFSRPDWKMIGKFIQQHVLRDDVGAAWNYVTCKWLEEMKSDWGGGCRLYSTAHFYCLSDIEPVTLRKLLDYAEFTLQSIGSFLGSAAWSGYHGKHVLLIFGDPDDYFAYISYYYGDGSHMLSAGIFIRSGYAHIALPYGEMLGAQHVLSHELAHNLLCHLPIPVWLNEGLAVTIENQMTRHRFVMDRELAERHRQLWTEANIQKFWSGRSFDEPGEVSQLSYNLGLVLVTLLAEKGPAFAEFVKTADWRDAGQDAALNFLGVGLEEVLSGFLGPGDWRPQRKLIRELLDQRKQQSNQSDR